MEQGRTKPCQTAMVIWRIKAPLLLSGGAQALLRTSVPFCPQVAAGAQGRGLGRLCPGHSSSGLCPSLRGEQGLPGTGRRAAVCWSLVLPNLSLHAAGSCRVAPRFPPQNSCHVCCPQLGSQAPATPRRPSLRPSLLSHGLQMGFYCILFCSAGGNGLWWGSGRSCPPSPGGTG